MTVCVVCVVLHVIIMVFLFVFYLFLNAFTICYLIQFAKNLIWNINLLQIIFNFEDQQIIRCPLFDKNGYIYAYMYLFLGLTCEPKQYSFCSVDYLPSVTTGSNVNPNKTCKSFLKNKSIFPQAKFGSSSLCKFYVRSR